VRRDCCRLINGTKVERQRACYCGRSQVLNARPSRAPSAVIGGSGRAGLKKLGWTGEVLQGQGTHATPHFTVPRGTLAPRKWCSPPKRTHQQSGHFFDINYEGWVNCHHPIAPSLGWANSMPPKTTAHFNRCSPLQSLQALQPPPYTGDGHLGLGTQ
jgi:hypothetical protein